LIIALLQLSNLALIIIILGRRCICWSACGDRECCHWSFLPNDDSIHIRVLWTGSWFIIVRDEWTNIVSIIFWSIWSSHCPFDNDITVFVFTFFPCSLFIPCVMGSGEMAIAYFGFKADDKWIIDFESQSMTYFLWVMDRG